MKFHSVFTLGLAAFAAALPVDEDAKTLATAGNKAKGALPGKISPGEDLTDLPVPITKRKKDNTTYEQLVDQALEESRKETSNAWKSLTSFFTNRKREADGSSVEDEEVEYYRLVETDLQTRAEEIKQCLASSFDRITSAANSSIVSVQKRAETVKRCVGRTYEPKEQFNAADDLASFVFKREEPDQDAHT